MNSRQHLDWHISRIQSSSPFLIRLTILHISHLKKGYKNELIGKSYFKYAFRKKKKKPDDPNQSEKKGNIIIQYIQQTLFESWLCSRSCVKTQGTTQSPCSLTEPLHDFTGPDTEGSHWEAGCQYTNTEKSKKSVFPVLQGRVGL